ncbi:MAG: FG-GAP-like repeat-containing protein [Candidatus Eiseniibacteriota bacterium]
MSTPFVFGRRLHFAAAIFALPMFAAAAETPNWIAEGDQDDAWFGVSVGTAGDVNGDGFDDVIVGAYLYDNGELDEGRAFVYHGSVTGLAADPAWTAESDQPGAWFGYSVGTAGDVNGDGFDDVIVGAWHFSNGQSEEGRAYVYHGSATGLAATPAWITESDEVGAHLGISVGTAGDVNGDGFDDVVIGAWHHTNFFSHEGMAVGYHGSAAGLETSASWHVEGEQADAYHGISVGTAGDVNGDGYDEVIVGAYGFDNQQSQEGRAHVYPGSAWGLEWMPTWTTESNQTAAYLGISVGTAGDVNDDGYSDVIVGAYQYGNGHTAEGKALLFHGTATGVDLVPTWYAEGGQTAAYYGISVGTAGDVNGDGFSDAIVGSYLYDLGGTDDGAVFVHDGSETGIRSAPDRTLGGPQSGAQFGVSAATAGDVNGDGLSDVIVGAWTYSDGEFEEGAALVFHGSSSATSVASSAGPVSGGALGLEPGIPNPTAGETELRFALPVAGGARLSVLDATGRHAALILDGERGPGLHSVRWSGRDARGAKLAPGVYFVRLEQAGRSEVRKLVLVR